MTSVWKYVTQRLSLSVIALLLIVLLAACSSLGGTASSPTPTTATPSPTPSPTPAVTTYTGDGYTISYPKDWKKSVASGQTTFQDSLGANALGVVVVANPDGVAKPSTVLEARREKGKHDQYLPGEFACLSISGRRDLGAERDNWHSRQRRGERIV